MLPRVNAEITAAGLPKIEPKAEEAAAPAGPIADDELGSG
jgi:hypothetical protein